MTVSKRIFDVSLAAVLLLLFAPLFLILGALVRLSSPGPALYFSDRIGLDGKSFRMPKFRSMRTDAPQLASHLLSDPAAYLTPVGPFLRSTSLDELPQLWSILCGHLSFVGPRPALFNQHDLIALRQQHGVDRLLPGLTGWAQINGRDELSIPAKVAFDREYLLRRSFSFDMKVLALTFVRTLRRDGITH